MECLQTLNVNLFGKHCAAAQSTFSKGLAFWIFGTWGILQKKVSSVLLFGSFSLQAQHTNTMTGQFKTWGHGSIFKWEYWLNPIYHKTFGLLFTSRFRSHTLDIFQRKELFQFIRGVVFDEVTGVGEGNDGVGHVLTEDHNEVARVPDQPSQHPLRDFLDFCRLQMGDQPPKHCLVVDKNTCVKRFF